MSWMLTGIAGPMALAVVALVGYWIGLRKRNELDAALQEVEDSKRNLYRADSVIRQVESVSAQLRRHLAAHHASVRHCQEQIRQLGEQMEPASEADDRTVVRRVLEPTDAVATEIATAYNELRTHMRTLSELHVV